MKIGQIAYTNTKPFFHAWESSKFELMPGTPQSLSEAARKGEIVAGPLPLVECWNLEDVFEPLGNWSIAAGERCRSVYVLSHIPFSELDHVMIGVTKESATSVILCETLIRQKYGNDVRLRKGLQAQDAGWLVIGDQALELANNTTSQAWPYITDLATEWWNWKQLPFVFARWVVRRDLAPDLKNELNELIGKSLLRGKAAMTQISNEVAPKLKVSPSFVSSYLNEFIYEMGPEAQASEIEFRKLVKEGATLGNVFTTH